MINFKKKFLVAVVLSLTLLSSSSLMAKGNVGITLDQAMVIVKAAKAQALKQGTLMNIAVVDADMCVDCEACVDECPAEAIHME